MENSPFFSSPPPLPPPLRLRRSEHQPPPSTPPVPHRLRRQPKQQALLQRSGAQGEFTPPDDADDEDEDDLIHTTSSIRPVLSSSPADAAKFSARAASAASLQLHAPAAAAPHPHVPAPRSGQGRTRADPVKASHRRRSSSSRAPTSFFQHPGLSSGVPRPNTQDASSPALPDRPINAPLVVLLTPPDAPPSSAVRQRLIVTPPTSSSDSHPQSSSPPWITYHHQPGSGQPFTSSPPDSVERERLHWRVGESDDEDVSLPTPLHEQFLSGRRAPTPRGMQHPHSLPYYETPPSSSSHQGHAESIASRIASSLPNLLSSSNTPASATSIGSAGTVRRNRRYTGHVPPGFYTLFPPRPGPRTPQSSRTARSSSDPARPANMYTVSPPSSGAGGSPASPRSPVSPMPPSVSPLSAQRASWAGRGSVYIDESRSQSETALHLRQQQYQEQEEQDIRIPVSQYGNSLRPPSLLDQISRQVAAAPAPRRLRTRRSSGEWQSGRWDSHMSTIHSEDGTVTTDRAPSNELARGSRTPSAEIDLAGMVAQFPQSPTTTTRLDGPSTPPQQRPGRAREGSDTDTYATQKVLPPLPERSPKRSSRQQREMAAPPAAYRPEGRSRDSQAGPSHLKQPSTASFHRFRESIQPWARSYYADERGTRKALFGRPDSVSSQAMFDSYASRRETQARPDSLRMTRSRQLELLRQHRLSRTLAPDPNRLSHRHLPALIIPRHADPRNFIEPPPKSVMPPSPPDRAAMANPLRSHPPDVETLQRLTSRRRQLQVEPRRAHGDWSPHLVHDRRSVVDRRRTFIAPSIDESVEGYRPSRRNLQIWMFALGFVLPPMWIVAAFLPLPDGPSETMGSTAFDRDLEKTLGPDDVARHESARWWRRINRCMAPVGLALIAAIIVLVIVAMRFEGARG